MRGSATSVRECESVGGCLCVSDGSFWPDRGLWLHVWPTCCSTTFCSSLLAFLCCRHSSLKGYNLVFIAACFCSSLSSICSRSEDSSAMHGMFVLTRVLTIPGLVGRLLCVNYSFAFRSLPATFRVNLLMEPIRRYVSDKQRMYHTLLYFSFTCSGPLDVAFKSHTYFERVFGISRWVPI